MSCAGRSSFFASAPRMCQVTVLFSELTLPCFSFLFQSATFKTENTITRGTVVCQLYAEEELLRGPLLVMGS